jgi:hypothetical protein
MKYFPINTTNITEPGKNFCRFLDQGLVYNNNTVNFTVSPCCYFSKSNTLDITQDVVSQIYQHRLSWKQDDLSTTCKICLDQEKAGLTSYRQASFDMVPESGPDLAVLTIAVNKQCNLACLSCGPHSSSFWYQQNIRDNVPQIDKIIQLHQEDRLGKIKQKFLSIFDHKFFQNIKYIKFGGGEPLMSTIHVEILQSITNPKETQVQYTSNFSIEPSEKVFDLWSRFLLVKWCASIDGVGDQFNLLRWPHRWDNLEKMIPSMINAVPHNVMFGIEHTLNPINIWYVDQFQQWARDNFSSNRYNDAVDLNFHCCTGNLGLDQTPPQLRKDIKQRLGPNHPAVILLDNTPYCGSYHVMVNWLDDLDRRRGTDWRKTFSPVSDYFQ